VDALIAADRSGVLPESLPEAHTALALIVQNYDWDFRSVLAMEPNFSRTGMVINAYVEKGLFADALADIEKRHRFAGDGPWRWSALAYVYGRSGQQAQARHALEKLEQLNRPYHRGTYRRAVRHHLLDH
jgi:Flp pilus assembly protein TadD